MVSSLRPRTALTRMVLAAAFCAVAGGLACGTRANSGYAGTDAGVATPPGSTDDGGAGTPGAGGLGLLGGGADAGSEAGAGGMSSGVTPLLIDRCTATSGGPDATTTAALLKGGSSGSLRVLYPYDGTVFPRGLIAPTVMWDGSSADYVYLHITSTLFEYKGCLAPTAPGQRLIPQDVWEAAWAHASGAGDPLKVSLTVIASGKAAGPVSIHVVVAPATLKGSIYYNSYVSKLGTAGGAVLRIQPGKQAEAFLNITCVGCHSVSANGSRMVASSELVSNSSYALTPDGGANPAPKASVPDGTFVGLYPDGSLYVSNGHPGGMGPRYPTSANAQLYETDTGQAVSGSNIPVGAMSPSFSPDGKWLTFNDYAIGNGTGLALMAFDKNGRAASGYKKIYQAATSGTYPGWPFFLPDDKGIVFALGTATDFSGGGAGVGVGTPAGTAPQSDLYVLDVASGSAVMLAKAMGFATPADAAANNTYLPFGAGEEAHHNYYPTISPVAAGGYFWVFWDSYRHYGNLGLQRQLWGAAIDVSPEGTYTADRSHPAFYLTGQEAATGNHRAFTALDPCRADGASCATGVDCCNGFCTAGTCGIPAPRCSNTDEACGSGHTCCDKSQQCINGFCSTVVLQ